MVSWLIRLVRGHAARQIKVNNVARCARYSTSVTHTSSDASTGTNGPGMLTLEQAVEAKFIWRRIKKILSIPNLSHVQPVERKDVRAWYTFVTADDFQSAVESVQRIDEVPVWALIYALTTKVHSEDDAHLAVTVMLQNTAKFSELDQPAIIIHTVRSLAMHQHVLSIPPLLDEFLLLPMQDPELQFDLLLRSLSRFKPSIKMSKNIIRVLEAMRTRGLRIRPHSYNAILANRFVTMELTSILQNRMREEGHVPNREQLEAFLRIFGTNGYIHAGARYLNFIRHMLREEDSIVPAPVIARDLTYEIRTKRGRPATRYNTEFMRTLVRYPGSAFHYLHSLLDAEKYDEDGNPVEEGATDGNDPSQDYSRSQATHPTTRQWKTRVDVYDWTMTLHAAAMDQKLSAEKLLSIFEGSKNTLFKPSVATYTTVIRGLIRKGADYGLTLKLWREMCEGLTRMDKVALTVGMDVLVGSGNALEAFHYIKNATSPESRVVQEPTHRTRFHKTATPPRVDTRLVDTILVNSFMSALLVHDRPDVVLLLWDRMKDIFGLQQNAVTLALMLKAARRVHHLDHSLQAAMTQLSAMMGRKTESEGTSNDEIVAEIEGKLATEQVEVDGRNVSRWKIPVSSQWHGLPAGTKAIAIFCAIMYSHWPRLRDIEPPALANWSDAAHNASIIANIARSFRLSPGASRATVDANIARANLLPALSPYLSVVPDEKAFAAYISLLGSQNCASEIPLALAWMRELDVIPTKVTTARALALWAEVSLRGPLVEQYAPASTNAFAKLTNWLQEWLGSAAIPSEGRIAIALRDINREREDA